MALGCHSPCGVVLAENVEQEGLHVIVQSFVIQKQFGQQAKVLAVKFGLGTIHLQPCNSVKWYRRDKEVWGCHGCQTRKKQGSISGLPNRAAAHLKHDQSGDSGCL